MIPALDRLDREGRQGGGLVLVRAAYLLVLLGALAAALELDDDDLGATIDDLLAPMGSRPA